MTTRQLLSCILGLTVIGASAAGSQTSPGATALRLPRFFATGMVVQRDTRIPVWGWAAPRGRVSVAFQGHTERATADDSGAWRVELPAAHAGGPYELTVESGGQKIELGDVLVGDVWVASGQSNMEWIVANVNNAPREIANAHDARLRQFKVPHSWSWTPQSDLTGGQWT